MAFFHDFYDGQTHFDFPKLWRYFLILSSILLVASVASLATRGLNLGIDFEGGTAWEYKANGVSVDQVREVLRPYGAEGAKIQTVGSDTVRISSDIEAETIPQDEVDGVRGALAGLAGVDAKQVTVTRVSGTWEVPATGITEDQVKAALEPVGYQDAKVTIDDNSITVLAPSVILDITNSLTDLFGSEPLSVTSVGPSWGQEITRQAIRALVWFFIAIAIYISIRLEWKMAVGALIAVVHDVVISVGIYSILQIEVTPSTVIAFLTILGYSLYDTIVVYDKVRENGSRQAVAGRMTYTDLMGMSLNQVFTRSVNTTIAPVLSILIVGSVIFGAITLQEFGLALLIGLLVGAYSSLFVAAPVVTWMKEREPRNRQLRERLEATRDATGRAPSAKVPRPAKKSTDDSELEVVSVGGSDDDDETNAPASSARPAGWQGSHPPRPRKKSKRRR